MLTENIFITPKRNAVHLCSRSPFFSSPPRPPATTSLLLRLCVRLFWTFRINGITCGLFVAGAFHGAFHVPLRVTTLLKECQWLPVARGHTDPCRRQSPFSLESASPSRSALHQQGKAQRRSGFRRPFSFSFPLLSLRDSCLSCHTQLKTSLFSDSPPPSHRFGIVR